MSNLLKTLLEDNYLFLVVAYATKMSTNMYYNIEKFCNFKIIPGTFDWMTDVCAVDSM